MAEIRVERKQGAGKWLWIVLLLVVIIAVAAYLWQAGYINLGGGASNIVEVVSSSVTERAVIAGGFNGEKCCRWHSSWQYILK